MAERTIDEHLERLRELREESLEGDREEAHREADDILCTILRDAGHDAVVDAYHAVEKWFA